MKDMIIFNHFSLKDIIVLVKQYTIVFEHRLRCIEHGHIVVPSQGIQSMLVGKDVLFVKAKFHRIKHSVTSVLCVTTKITHKLHLLKELHLNRVRGQMENVIVFIFPTTLIHRDRESLPWVALH
jgi:hypothetical protein